MPKDAAKNIGAFQLYNFFRQLDNTTNNLKKYFRPRQGSNLESLEYFLPKSNALPLRHAAYQLEN